MGVLNLQVAPRPSSLRACHPIISAVQKPDDLTRGEGGDIRVESYLVKLRSYPSKEHIHQSRLEAYATLWQPLFVKEALGDNFSGGAG